MERVDDFSDYDGVLVVGCGDSYENNIFIYSNGWNIYINKSETSEININPIGACAAACFGTAELFKTVVKPSGYRLCGSMSISLLNYNTDLPMDNLKNSRCN